MFVRHRTWRSSSLLATALAMWGQDPQTAEFDVPVRLSRVVRFPEGEPTPGSEILLGIETPEPVGAEQRLVVWERLESRGETHTLFLRGALVPSGRDPSAAARVVFRPQEPGEYRIVDAATAGELHRFRVASPPFL